MASSAGRRKTGRPARSGKDEKSDDEAPPKKKSRKGRKKEEFCLITDCKGIWVDVEKAMQDESIQEEWESVITVFDNPPWIKSIRILECGALGSCGYFSIARWLAINKDEELSQKDIRRWFASELQFDEQIPGIKADEMPTVQAVQLAYLPTFNLEPFAQDHKKKLRVTKEMKYEQVPDREILKFYIDDIVRADNIARFQEHMQEHALNHEYQLDEFSLEKLVNYKYFKENSIGFITLKIDEDQDKQNTIFCQVYPVDRRNYRKTFIVLYNYASIHWQLFGMTADKGNKDIVTAFTRENLHPILLQSTRITSLLGDKAPPPEEKKRGEGSSLEDYSDIVAALDEVVDEEAAARECKGKTDRKCKYILSWLNEAPCTIDDINNTPLNPIETIVFRVKSAHRMKRICLDARKLKLWLAELRARDYDSKNPGESKFIPTDPPIRLTSDRLRRIDRIPITKPSFESDLTELVAKVVASIPKENEATQKTRLRTLHFYLLGTQHQKLTARDSDMNKLLSLGDDDNKILWFTYALNADAMEPDVTFR